VMVNGRLQQPGFVMLIVLVVLAVAGSVLAITAGHCCRQALAAGAAARALQVEWGSLSCRAVCLPGAEALLAGESARLGGPVSTVRRTVVLGRVRFVLVASDEQAKADVNLLEHRFGRDVASATPQGPAGYPQTFRAGPKRRLEDPHRVYLPGPGLRLRPPGGAGVDDR